MRREAVWGRQERERERERERADPLTHSFTHSFTSSPIGTVNPIELVILLSQFDELTVAWLACFICYFCGSGWRTLKKVVAHLVISVH